MWPKSLPTIASLAITVMVGLTIVFAAKTLWPVPVSPKLSYTIFAEPLPESARFLQTFNVHTSVSRVDFRIRVRKQTVAVLEVLDSQSGRVLRTTSVIIVPGDMDHTFTFPVIGSSVQGPVYRPITFALSFPDQRPGTYAGIAIELTDSFPAGKLSATGITIPRRADAHFQAFRDTTGLDIAGLLIKHLSNRKPEIWVFGLALGLLGMFGVTALTYTMIVSGKHLRWALAIVPGVILFLSLVALSAPLTNIRLITF